MLLSMLLCSAAGAATAQTAATDKGASAMKVPPIAFTEASLRTAFA